MDSTAVHGPDTCGAPRAALVRAMDPDQARAVLTPDRYADIEVHNWQFGGRPVMTRGRP